MTPTSAVPPAEVDLTPAIVAELVACQFPDLAGLSLGSRFEGWDNVTTRLGDRLAVRTPRIAAAVPLLEREIRWLPELGTAWGFGVPIPVRVGEPSPGYPWRWTVVPWFDGVEAAASPLGPEGASDLGRALRQVHVPAAVDAPTTPWRTTPLEARVTEAMGDLEALDALAGREGLGWDGEAARALWLEAAGLPWHAASWVHADIHAKNLITDGGRLAAILDWGEAGAGDPAQDLGQAWLLCAADDVGRVFSAYGEVDDETVTRAKGEAITTAARLISTGDPGFVTSGWLGLVNLGLASGPPPPPSRREKAT